VKSLTLGKAIVNALLPNRNQKDVTSLIEEFQYPKYGPGMMWETCRDKVVAKGSTVALDTTVTKIRHRGGKAYEVEATAAGGTATTIACDHVVSSMPISELLEAMDPPPPADVLAAARDLQYRDFLTVALVVPADRVPWTDNWIYIHDPNVRTMRIQNFGSWSPYLVKEGRNVLGLEYTLWETDDAWTAPDEQHIEQGRRELDQLGLVSYGDVEGGYVVRQKKAYPVYDDRYQANVEVLRAWLAEHASNVHPVGRNGMFRYNNQDHSMYTALLTAENIATGSTHDVWEVNVEEEYHEEGSASSNGSGSGSHRPGGRRPGSHGTGRDAPVLPREVIEASRPPAV
jgi:protoporphyrinogen oxidase